MDEPGSSRGAPLTVCGEIFFGLESKILSLPKRLNPQFTRGIDVGAFIALIIKFLSIALAYLQNIVLAHCMLPEAFGEYAMGLSIAMALGVTIAASVNLLPFFDFGHNTLGKAKAP